MKIFNTLTRQKEALKKRKSVTEQSEKADGKLL